MTVLVSVNSHFILSLGLSIPGLSPAMHPTQPSISLGAPLFREPIVKSPLSMYVCMNVCVFVRPIGLHAAPSPAPWWLNYSWQMVPTCAGFRAWEARFSGFVLADNKTHIVSQNKCPKLRRLNGVGCWELTGLTFPAESFPSLTAPLYPSSETRSYASPPVFDIQMRCFIFEHNDSHPCCDIHTFPTCSPFHVSK